MTRRHVALLGLAALAGSCAERDGQVLGPDASAAVSVAGQVHTLARGFALALAVPEVRAAVRDAMRASPLTEHKLSLQQFAATGAGQRLLRATAAAVGTDHRRLEALITSLPDLDFYVPARIHRLTWRGTDDYLVAVSLDGRAPTEGYDREGRRARLDFSRPEPAHHAVLMLQAAETKSPRIGRQADRPGLVIQDPGDGELSGSLLVADGSGAVRTVYLADLVHASSGVVTMSECLEDCGGGGGGGGNAPGPRTLLERIATNGICDNGNCWEGNEFEFRATATTGQTSAIRIEGIGCCEWNNGTGRLVHRHLISALPPMWVGGENSRIAARETDAFNADDWFFFTDLYYCGAVQLDADDDAAFWYLTESSCDVQAPKTLGVQYTWVF